VSTEKRTQSSNTVPIDQAEIARRLREVFGDELVDRAARRDEIPPPPPSGVQLKEPR
jgi:hypothetical protein